MNFELTKEHELLRKMIREFAEKEITPIAAEIDETEEFPLEVVKKMAKLGIMGLPIPREYGGAGADYVAYSILIEELSKAYTAIGTIVAAHTSLCTWPILAFGTEEQKEKYVKLISKLDALSPLKTLARGYSIIEQNGEMVNSVKQLKSGTEIDIKLVDGNSKAKII